MGYKPRSLRERTPLLSIESGEQPSLVQGAGPAVLGRSFASARSATGTSQTRRLTLAKQPGPPHPASGVIGAIHGARASRAFASLRPSGRPWRSGAIPARLVGFARDAPASRKHSASPYCLHDFHAITIAQFMLPVAAARHDFAVHFDGDAAFAMAGFGEQRCDRRGGRTFT